MPGSILALGAGVLFGAVGLQSMFLGATIGAASAFPDWTLFARGWVTKQIEGSDMFKAMTRPLPEGWKIVGLMLSPLFPLTY